MNPMNPTMQDSMRQLMQDATRLTQAGQLQEATQLIQRALSGGPPLPQAAPASADVAGTPACDALVIDGCVFEIDEAAKVGAAGAASDAQPHVAEPAARQPSKPATAGNGAFVAGSFSNAAGTRSFKLYVPPQRFLDSGKPLPLVLMLHGCTQNPDDFAAGTGMNALAEAQGFYVLYPAQAQSANTSGCWNWFKHNHQARGRGEPALLAGMTQDVMAKHGIDPQRVFVAGLSAGGAMAAVLAQAYPELFAAAGVHSGLPVGSANDMMSALAVMKDGREVRSPGLNAGSRPAAPRAARPTAPHGAAVSTIVFHGDSDTTVHPRNGEQVVAAALGVSDLAEAAASAAGSTSDDTSRVHRANAQAAGRRHSHRVYRKGPAVVEHWVVHGAGHAWSGGRSAGSYTDPQGPDASAEMWRFFVDHPMADSRSK